MTQTIRNAVEADLNALADIWYQGWFEADKDHVPQELAALRTRESLRARLKAHLENTLVVGPIGAPLGMCIHRGPEIYQIYVDPQARGSGTAKTLIKAGEIAIKDAGFKQARLDVIPQNHRAIAFYEKSGWTRGSVETIALDTLGEPFPLECLVMHKDL